MLNRFSRTEFLIGKDSLESFKKKTITVFGVGGVGSYAIEALARSGIFNFNLIDPDNIDITNINRQIHATTSTIGKSKVEVMKERILDINPDAKVNIFKIFVTNENIDDNILDKLFKVDYVIDAIDTISAKIAIIQKAKENNIKIISSMGAGNKLNPNLFKITDISKTKVCPVAKVIRKELRNMGIKDVTVVYSEEEPIAPFIPSTCFTGCCIPEENPLESISLNKETIGSIAFIPSTVGLLIASHVIKELMWGYYEKKY